MANLTFKQLGVDLSVNIGGNPITAEGIDRIGIYSFIDTPTTFEASQNVQSYTNSADLLADLETVVPGEAARLTLSPTADFDSGTETSADISFTFADAGDDPDGKLPATVNVTFAANADATDIATAIETAFNADAVISAYWSVDNTADVVTLVEDNASVFGSIPTIAIAFADPTQVTGSISPSFTNGSATNATESDAYLKVSHLFGLSNPPSSVIVVFGGATGSCDVDEQGNVSNATGYALVEDNLNTAKAWLEANEIADWFCLCLGNTTDANAVSYKGTALNLISYQISNGGVSSVIDIYQEGSASTASNGLPQLARRKEYSRAIIVYYTGDLLTDVSVGWYAIQFNANIPGSSFTLDFKGSNDFGSINKAIGVTEAEVNNIKANYVGLYGQTYGNRGIFYGDKCPDGNAFSTWVQLSSLEGYINLAILNLYTTYKKLSREVAVDYVTTTLENAFTLYQNAGFVAGGVNAPVWAGETVNVNGRPIVQNGIQLSGGNGGWVVYNSNNPTPEQIADNELSPFSVYIQLSGFISSIVANITVRN